MERRSMYNNNACTKKNKRSQFDYSHLQDISNLKSIKTQTDESSFLFDSCSSHRRSFANSTNDDSMQALNPNHIWKPDCTTSLCPACSRSVFPTSYPQTNNQLYQYAWPWYAPYGQYNGCVPPPFMPLQMFHSLMPYNGNFGNSFHNLDSTPSKTSMNRTCKGSVTSITDNDAFNNVSSFNNNNNDRCNLTSWGKSKLKASYIQSEPDVTKNKKNCSSNGDLVNNFSKKNGGVDRKCDRSALANFINNKNVLKKDRYKSESDIPGGMNLKYKSAFNESETDGKLSKEDGNFILHKFGKKEDDSKGDYRNVIYNSTELKSPIYKYADIRIHELSSSLKNIKDNIYKLSTKASELNVCDSGTCESDDNFKKYFRSVYTQFNDSDIKSLCVIDDLSGKGCKSIPSDRFNNSNSNININDNRANGNLIDQLKNHFNNSESPSCSNSSLQKKEMSELFSNRLCSKSNYELSDSYKNRINLMKRTVPLYDIPSLLNQNDEETSSQQEQVPVKMKSDFLVSKKKYTNDNTITAHVLVPNRSHKFNNEQDNGRKGQNLSIGRSFNKRKFNSLNRQYANISFKVNYDSPNDEDNLELDFSVNENGINICNENIPISSDEKQCPGYQKGNEELSHCEQLVCQNINEDCDNIPDNNEYVYKVDCDNIRSDSDFNYRSEESLAIRNQQSIENWLERSIENGVPDINGYQKSSNHKQQQQCQFSSAMSNLEALSKISEEDEDKLSCVSECSDQPKRFAIREKSCHNGYERSKHKYSADIRKISTLNNECVTEKVCFSGMKDGANVIGKSHPYLEEKHVPRG